MADIEQSRRMADVMIQRSANLFQRRQSLDQVKQMEENERRRRVIESHDYLDRRSSIEEAIRAQEDERDRRLEEMNVSAMDDEKDRIGGIEFVVDQAEDERQRRLIEGIEDEPSYYWTVLNEEIHKDWNKVKAIELEKGEQARRTGAIVAEECADAFQRKITQQEAVESMETERAERIGEQVASQALEKVWRSLSKRKSLDQQEIERSRRIGQATFTQAGDEAVRQKQVRRASLLADEELARRIAVEVAQDTAVAAGRRLSIKTADRLVLEDFEDFEEKDGPGYSELMKTVGDELEDFYDDRERVQNQNRVKKEQHDEQTRRRSIESGERLMDELARFNTQQKALQMLDDEQTRRVGEIAAYDAADAAQSIIGRRNSIEMQETERARRIAEEDEDLAQQLAFVYSEGVFQRDHQNALYEAAGAADRRNSINASIEASELERSRRLENAAILHEAPIGKMVSEAFQEGYQRKIGVKVIGEAAAVGRVKHSRSVLNNMEEVERHRRLSIDRNEAVHHNALISQAFREGLFQ